MNMRSVELYNLLLKDTNNYFSEFITTTDRKLVFEALRALNYIEKRNINISMASIARLLVCLATRRKSTTNLSTMKKILKNDFECGLYEPVVSELISFFKNPNDSKLGYISIERGFAYQITNIDGKATPYFGYENRKEKESITSDIIYSRTFLLRFFNYLESYSKLV